MNVFSFSGGKDSTAQILLAIEKGIKIDAVIFYNSGVEFDCIYKVVDSIKKLLPTYTKFIEVKPKLSFIDYALNYKFTGRDGKMKMGYSWCGGKVRYGTTLKIEAINNFLQSIGTSYVQYVGIAYNEKNRYDKLSVGKKSLLYEEKFTEKMCLEYCHSKGIYWYENNVELYDILDRVSCWCCANKNEKELYNIWKYLHNYWEKLKDFEKRARTPFRTKIKYYEKDGKMYYKKEILTIKYYEKLFESGYIPKRIRNEVKEK